MFGILNKLKVLKEIISQKISDTVDDLQDEGYEAEQIEDDTIEIEVSDDYNDLDIEERLEEEFPVIEDIGGGGVSWLPYYFKYKHMEDRTVCNECREFGDIYVNKLELRRDGTGDLHKGGDEDVISYLLEGSAYTVQDLAQNPDSVPLNIHASQKGQPPYMNTCRCILQLVT